jgi:3'(2'), 5'-bisphosphate nucleotidase
MLEHESRIAVELARGAGRILMDIYARDFSVAYKTKNDPVTEGDKLANAYLVEQLRAHFPGDGIVAEESPEQGDALTKQRCWFVDPLDGTRSSSPRTASFL